MVRVHWLPPIQGNFTLLRAVSEQMLRRHDLPCYELQERRFAYRCEVSMGQRRWIFAALGTLTVCSVIGSSAGAQPLRSASTPRESGVLKLSVEDKNDIRFSQLAINGEPFQEGVQSITQDNHGFLWLGTNGGLYRYDGYTLKHYKHDPNDLNSLSDNRIRVVYRDRQGILWTGGGNLAGLDQFDPTDETFRHYRHNPADDGGLSDNGVGCIYQDRSGVVWVGTRRGLNRLDAARGTFVRYYFDD